MRKLKRKNIFKKIGVFLLIFGLLFTSFKYKSNAMSNYFISNVNINTSFDLNDNYFNNYINIYTEKDLDNTYWNDIFYPTTGGYHYKLNYTIRYNNNTINCESLSINFNVSNGFLDVTDFVCYTNNSFTPGPGQSYSILPNNLNIIKIDILSYKGSGRYTNTIAYNTYKYSDTLLDLVFNFTFTYSYDMQRDLDYQTSLCYFSPVINSTNSFYGNYYFTGETNGSIKVYSNDLEITKYLQYNSLSSNNMGIYTAYYLNRILNFNIYANINDLDYNNTEYNFADLLLSLLNVPIIYLQNLFSFEILGINFYALVFSVVLVSLILYFVFKIMRNGR